MSTVGELRALCWCNNPHPALNVSGCGFGVFKLFHRRKIPQKITMSCREPIQQIVLQLFGLNLEVVLLHGLLHLGNHTQQIQAKFHN